MDDADLLQQLGWEILSTSVYLQDLRDFWARTLGVSGPQWLILMALVDLDKGEGAPVKLVAKMLQVDASFITTQSKMLEKKGLLRRKPSPADARVVQMSMTEKAYKHIASLAAQQEKISSYVFEGFSDHELREFTQNLTKLKNSLGKASLKLSSGI
jgi:DNA-binding MarR family transcriptional regulator